MFFKNEVVGVADVETEKLIAELRDYFDGKNLNHATAMRAADALERLTAESAEKDAEIKRLKEQVQYNHDCYFSEFAEKNRLQAELDAAVDDLKIASDCATCDMRGEKGFSACAPLFVGDEQSCKNYKWRGKENGDGKENS